MASGALLLTTPGAWAFEDVVTFGGDAFGSYWRLTLSADRAEVARAAGLEAIIAGIDAGFSPYRGDSLLSRFNASASTDWQEVDGAMHGVLAAGLDLAASSGGAFDPTVGPTVARFGFGPITGSAGHYSEIALAPGAIRKQRADLSLDLCGIAKGYALDLMAARLAESGIDAFLLDLGGELLARGAHPSGRSWHVAVDAPSGGLSQSFALNNRAVATSGSTVQAYRLGDETIGHIIDPLTGRPSRTLTASVSVLADSAMLADGWATALMAMPHPVALTLAQARGLDALFLIKRDDGFEPVATGAFASLLKV